jgi:omega-amidase
MNVALIQAPLVWENPKANCDYFEEKIKSVSDEIDLVILPEMFSTGFTMNPSEVWETMEGETISLLKNLAKARNLAITGSLIIKEDDEFYNRLVFIFPSGEIKKYDKRHLFSLADEEKVYTAGKDKLIVDYLGWKICPLICYDLRFPVFARNVEAYDLLIYVANWPKVRINAWDILLKARAVENMTYTIGVNRIGEDVNDFAHSGHSQVVDFLGNYMVEPQNSEAILITTLDKKEMLKTRKRLGFLNDRDNFSIEN